MSTNDALNKNSQWEFSSRRTIEQVEEGLELAPKFNDDDILPVLRNTLSPRSPYVCIYECRSTTSTIETDLLITGQDRDKNYGSVKLQNAPKSSSNLQMTTRTVSFLRFPQYPQQRGARKRLAMLAIEPVSIEITVTRMDQA